MADPQRTCHACRQARPKDELLRFVCGPDGHPVLDLRGKLPGRGAYLCPATTCLQRGLKPKGIARALDCGQATVGAGEMRQQALDGLRRMLLEHLGHAHRAGAVVPGMERVAQALTENDANWVLVANDAAERTRTEMIARVGNDGVVSALTKGELGAVLGTAEVGVLAITQPRLADTVRALAVRWNRLKEENGDGQG